MLNEWSVVVGPGVTRAVLTPADRPANGAADPGRTGDTTPSGDAGRLDEASLAANTRGPQPDILILGHGASSHRDHPNLLALDAALRRAGLATVRFNFLYTELKKGPPDRMPRLMETFLAVAESVRSRLQPRRLFLGGHSMGGRTASMLAADGYRADGLILLGYPLHPAGQPEKLRDAHLPQIQERVLCFNGDRDDLCTPGLMCQATDHLPLWTQHWVTAADHSFKTQKRSGRTPEDIANEITAATTAWLQASHEGELKNKLEQ